MLCSKKSSAADADAEVFLKNKKKRQRHNKLKIESIFIQIQKKKWEIWQTTNSFSADLGLNWSVTFLCSPNSEWYWIFLKKASSFY